MFLESVMTTVSAVIQVILMAGIGYFLVKRRVLDYEGIGTISRMTVELTLPVLIFCQLIKDFSFAQYADWWIFPLLSIAITLVGYAIGSLFIRFIQGEEHKKQFLGLTAFQNSGYLPLALIAGILPADKAEPMFIYLFLFLLGFNLVIWSFGVHLLSFDRTKKFELGSLFSPPVIATLFSLLVVFLGLNKFIPDFVIAPLKAVGNCTIPLSMIVVGGSLAQISLRKVVKKAMFLAVLVKMIILPALGLALVLILKLPELIGLLIVMELAVPSATNLSLIIRHYKKEDLLINQGVLFTHIVGIISLPFFLSLFFALNVVK
ncbi:MAG: AEC family transporter [Candidatus Omnitrophota bacterium]